MRFTLSNEQVLAVRQAAQQAQNDADLAVMANRRRQSAIDKEVADLQAKVGKLKGEKTTLTVKLPQLEQTFKDANEFYNRTLRVSPGSHVELDFGQLGFGQRLNLADIINNTVSETDFTYFVLSRTGHQTHTVKYNKSNVWECDCIGYRNRGTCWVTNAFKHGIQTDSKGQFILDENLKRHQVTRVRL